MFGESIDAVLKSAEAKLGFMKSNPLGYFMASAIAGMFITFGSMISMSIGGYLTALMGPATKIGAAIAFATAFSMVITAGWCILVFMVCGFEHSVANMSITGIALLNPCGEAVTWVGYAKSLGFVTIGNILGAVVMLALPYYLMARKREGAR